MEDRFRQLRLGMSWSLWIAALAALLLVGLACRDGDGEDRPSVMVIDESGSVSVSGAVSGSVSVSGVVAEAVTGTGVVEPGVVRPRPPAAQQVAVDLKEWSILPERAEIEAGAIYFLASNVGPVDPHELVIVRTDVAPGDLPVVEGKVPEDRVDIIGEIEPFTAGTVASGLFNLEPGSYVLICNIAEIEEGELESHYELGMRVAFTVTGTAASMGTEYYRPVSDVVSHAAVSLDMRDIGGLLQAAKTDAAVDWAGVAALYEKGGNSVKGDGSVRTLASLAASDSVLAEFPGGSSLDANVRVGLSGTWQGRSVDDIVRRQLINKGLQAVIYGKVLQELTAARAKIEQGKTDDSSGAPHNVDEAWAFYVGSPDEEGNRGYSIASTARSRAGNFGLDGKVDVPLQLALAEALKSSRSGDMAAYDTAAENVRGRLNTIFYLASLRYIKRAADDTETGARAEHLAEGWAFYQAIHPAVRSASSSAASTIEGHFTGDPSSAVTEESVSQVYGALNEAAVIEALGIPSDVRVTSPDQLR